MSLGEYDAACEDSRVCICRECLVGRQGHPGMDLVLWASRFHPVFEDDHFESR